MDPHIFWFVPAFIYTIYVISWWSKFPREIKEILFFQDRGFWGKATGVSAWAFHFIALAIDVFLIYHFVLK